jgi:hypothetical protein
MPKLQTAVELAKAPGQVESTETLAIVREISEGAAAEKPDFGYYHPPHGPPTKFKVVKVNEREATGWDEATGAEVFSELTVDIGYPDGRVAIKKCPIADAPKAGCFVYGVIKTRPGPPDLRGEEFVPIEIGKNQPLN